MLILNPRCNSLATHEQSRIFILMVSDKVSKFETF